MCSCLSDECYLRKLIINMPAIILNDKNFNQEVMKSDLPILVDMYSEWCPPCQLMLPIIDEIAEKFSGKIKVGKLCVDENDEIAALYKIEAVPCLYIFKDGEIIDKMVGPVAAEELERKIGALDFKTDGKEKVDALIERAEKYASAAGFALNPNKQVVENIAKGLLGNEEKHGHKYCPCRKISGNPEEDKKNICPCDHHRQEIEENGHCHCNLFVKK